MKRMKIERYCLKCGGAGEVKIPSSNPVYHNTQKCVDCMGIGLSVTHDCTDSCQEDGPHRRLRMHLQKYADDLEEEVMALKKKFDTVMAQVVTLADQHWETAKDKVEEITAIRDKIASGVPLSDEETRLVFFALTLVTGEARLRKANIDTTPML